MVLGSNPVAVTYCDATFIEHAFWKFVPLGDKTGKNLGAQIDIINALSMSMVKIFSQLLLDHIMDDR